jgi:hypothetical protein
VSNQPKHGDLSTMNVPNINAGRNAICPSTAWLLQQPAVGENHTPPFLRFDN